jgi:hypothetical protein
VAGLDLPPLEPASFPLIGTRQKSAPSTPARVNGAFVCSTNGICTGVFDLADAERVNRSYVCRVLRLTLLAPDIVERILDGRPTAGLAQFLKPFPVEWEKQRQKFCRAQL